MTEEQAWEEAIQLFNACQFFEAHEVIEEALWRPAVQSNNSTLSAFYQGVLQVGVGCYHLQQGNSDGALSLLKKGLNRLTPLKTRPPYSLWIDLERMLYETKGLIEELETIKTTQSGKTLDGALCHWQHFPTILSKKQK